MASCAKLNGTLVHSPVQHAELLAGGTGNLRETARFCGWDKKGDAETKKTRRFCLRVKSPAANRRDRLGRRKAYLATFEKALSYGLYASLARSLYISPILVTSPTKPS